MPAVKWAVAKLQGDKTASFCREAEWSRSYREIISIPIFHGTLLPMDFWTPPRFLRIGFPQSPRGKVSSFRGQKNRPRKKNKFLGTEVPRNFSDQCSLDFAYFLCLFSGRRSKSSQELCSWELFFLILGGFSPCEFWGSASPRCLPRRWWMGAARSAAAGGQHANHNTWPKAPVSSGYTALGGPAIMILSVSREAFSDSIAIASSSYRIEKPPSGPEDSRKICNIQKILFFGAIFLQLFLFFAPFFSPTFCIS